MDKQADFTEAEIAEIEKYLGEEVDEETFSLEDEDYEMNTQETFDNMAVYYDINGKIIYSPYIHDDNLSDSKLSVTSSASSFLIPCRFYPKCAYGESCKYYHPPDEEVDQQICKFYPNCRFGNDCKYSHPN